MKKTAILVVGILFFASCGDSGKKILIEGTTYVELNVRATPNSDGDRNILDDLDPGDVVQIVEFDTESAEGGIFWCHIRLDKPKRFEGKEIKYAWIAYKVRDLPFIVSNESWEKIERMYEMEYEKEFNETLTGSKTWLTQSIYDYVYYEPLRDIKHEYDLRGPEKKYDERDSPKDKYVTESPSYSVDLTFCYKHPCTISMVYQFQFEIEPQNSLPHKMCLRQMPHKQWRTIEQQAKIHKYHGSIADQSSMAVLRHCRQ